MGWQLSVPRTSKQTTVARAPLESGSLLCCNEGKKLGNPTISTVVRSRKAAGTWQCAVVNWLFLVFVGWRAPHVDGVVPLQRDGVHADGGLTAGPLLSRRWGHQLTHGLARGRDLMPHLLLPADTLQLCRVFKVCVPVRGLLFIFRDLERERETTQININRAN